jgi:phosphonate dehydrogenase
MNASSLPLVVVTQPLHSTPHEALRAFAVVEMNPGPEPWPRDKVIRLTSEADALLAFMTDHVDEEFLSRCPKLRIISCALKGADNFDVSACRRRGIAVATVPDLLTAPTAELAIGLMIGLGRNLRAGDELVRGGHFAGWRPVLYGTGLEGASVGLLGFGRIGRAIADRLRGFDCKLLAHDPAAVLPAGVESVGFEELLAQADFLVLALPLSRTTRHILNADALRQLKPHAVVVNVARGSLVDERAVAQALTEGRLGGYAADVFEMEDWAIADRPETIPDALLQHPRTLFTPHLGSAVDKVREAIEMHAVHSLRAFFNGSPVPGLLETE